MPVLFVDGRYQKFQAMTEDGDSDDGTKAMVEEFGGLYLAGWSPDGWPTQFVKRTAQFSTAKEDDWVICIDADERPLGDFQKLINWLDIVPPFGHARTSIRGDDGYGKMGFPAHRAFKMTRGFHLYGAHYIHWRENQVPLSRKNAPIIPDEILRLFHTEGLREKPRELARSNYYGLHAYHDEWRRPYFDPEVLE